MKRIPNWKLIQSWLEYFILLFISFLLAIYYRQTIFVVLSLLIVCLPVISFFITRYVSMKIECSISTTLVITEKNTTIPVKIIAMNHCVFPISDIEIKYHLNHYFYPNTQDLEIILPGLLKQTNSATFDLKLSKNGCFQAAISEFRIYDFLRLFSFRKKVDSSFEVLVIPSFSQEITFHPDLYTEGFDEYEESSSKGNHSSNVTDLREYIPGDRLQKIHWKLSAKIGKLMIKENENTTDHQFFVINELYLPSLDSPYLDLMLDHSFAFAKELLAHQQNFFYAYYSKQKEDFVYFTLKSEEDLVEALTELYYESTYDLENLGLITYQQSGLQKGSVVQITHKGVEHVLI